MVSSPFAFGGRRKKFGKLPPKPHLKTLSLAKYLSAVPTPPEKVYREYKVPVAQWGMDANDTCGDCTCACVAHVVTMMTAHTSTIVVPTVTDVVAMYSALSGYNPVTGANDNGAAITDVLNYWQTTGLEGHNILAWAAVNPANQTEVEQAVYIFGTVDIGISIYQSAMDQFNAGSPWNLPNTGSLLGGHSIPLFGYGSLGLTGVTWGALQQMSWDWLSSNCDEAYVVITQDWLDQATQETPSGFDLATLQADLNALNN